MSRLESRNCEKGKGIEKERRGGNRKNPIGEAVHKDLLEQNDAPVWWPSFVVTPSPSSTLQELEEDTERFWRKHSVSILR